MDVFPFNTDNTKALSASYAHDEFVSIDKTTNFSEGNLNLTSLTVLSALEDTTTNYYNKFFLTDFTTNDLGLTVNTNKSTYPKYITTTLKLRDQEATKGYSAKDLEKYRKSSRSIHPFTLKIKELKK